MRVGYVNQDPGVAPGRRKGAAAHVAALQSALREVGCTVVAIEQKDDAGVERELEAAHESQGLDAIYERHALGACGAARFARRSGVPLLLEVNSPLFDEAREHRGFEPQAADVERQRTSFEAAAWLFAVSTSVANYLLRHGASPARVRVLANAVDTQLFHPWVERPAELVLPRESCIVGFHGRLRPWHNLGLLARAVQRVVASGRAAHVLAVGEGDFARELAPLGSAGWTHVPWLSPESLARHVACFDVLPLTYAPGRDCYFSPLKLFEAMACGVAPLVPDLGELPGLVDGGRCGAVYPAGDEQALAAQLARWIDSPAERRSIGARAAGKAATRSWRDVAHEVLAFAAEAAQR